MWFSSSSAFLPLAHQAVRWRLSQNWLPLHSAKSSHVLCLISFIAMKPIKHRPRELFSVHCGPSSVAFFNSNTFGALLPQKLLDRFWCCNTPFGNNPLVIFLSSFSPFYSDWRAHLSRPFNTACSQSFIPPSLPPTHFLSPSFSIFSNFDAILLLVDHELNLSSLSLSLSLSHMLYNSPSPHPPLPFWPTDQPRSTLDFFLQQSHATQINGS